MRSAIRSVTPPSPEQHPAASGFTLAAMVPAINRAPAATARTPSRFGAGRKCDNQNAARSVRPRRHAFAAAANAAVDSFELVARFTSTSASYRALLFLALVGYCTSWEQSRRLRSATGPG